MRHRVIDHRLLAAGARRAVLVEATPAYLEAARAEAEEADLLDRMEIVAGDFVRRADEAEAQKLLGNQFPTNVGAAQSTHVMKGSAVWDLPDLRNSRPFLKAIALLVNDWQLSTIWTGAIIAQEG